ncbi:MAG TPA: alkaline phosphatase D family protein [Pirellulaceae bacterium]|nr:alkaline phosphatase D family protein [Pirellulaceae bacterium]
MVPPDPTSRRDFLQATVAGMTLAGIAANVSAAPVNNPKASDPQAIGPVLGHIDDHNAYLFYRLAEPGKVRLLVRNSANSAVIDQAGIAEGEHDNTVHFALRELSPDTSYRGELLSASDGKALPESGFTFRTPHSPARPTETVLGFGSCVSSTSFDELWQRIAAEKVEGFCLLGDTPYIDTNDLAANRRARRIFWGTLPTLGALAKRIGFWNTWDDHDFGRNDSDGLMPKKENIRQAFLEYNALASYGEDDAGIYTYFRRGPLEVWLIDDRWFSQTAPSWADPKQKTCLGEKQWEWLQRTLKSSTAPFKILCTGMVWYPKGNREKDHWETYAAERDALFAFIKRERISGVVLFSGDIHVSRHHVYDADRVGYPLHECVVSPMHDSVIPALDVKHPARVWSLPAPNVFLKVTASNLDQQPTLTATWINMQGKRLHEFQFQAPQPNG